jgi:hypothetical protein
MRKILSLSLLGLYLFSNVEFCQLLKIPLFIEHYQEYIANGEGDLMDFIVHHYGGHEKDSDWDTDMKLPFMTHSADLTLAFYLPKIQFDLDASPPVILSSSLACGKEQNLIPSYFNNILQPPRIG